jgi:hypothetical protein
MTPAMSGVDVGFMVGLLAVAMAVEHGNLASVLGQHCPSYIREYGHACLS